MGICPCCSMSIFCATLSTQVTSMPKSARQAPVTRPTYPVPTTQICMVRVLRSIGAHADGASDVVEHLAQLIVVGVPHPHPGVGHVAGLDGSGRGAGGREVGVDHPLAELPLQLLDPLVA